MSLIKDISINYPSLHLEGKQLIGYWILGEVVAVLMSMWIDLDIFTFFGLNKTFNNIEDKCKIQVEDILKVKDRNKKTVFDL